ncbi:Monoamine oxidase [Klebsiella pneumoniae]|uniref:Monoamine oxidase n=1 Tax=Klebsiella pneumoniae TaxID=573 RepID=A0A2X1QCM1_KLEPN|nr:Monoamine oxidase [Klebsiella pneumoniae]
MLKKHGITDPGKVVTTPLTVCFFDGKDGLQQDARLLKVVSYLDTGDGNYWAHPIENLVAVIDLEAKKIIKIEEGPVIPVPMEPRPYDGRDRNAPAVKPLDITEPEGQKTTPLPAIPFTGRTGISTCVLTRASDQSSQR